MIAFIPESELSLSTIPHSPIIVEIVSYDDNWAHIMRHDSPLAAPVVTPVKEAASGRAHVSVINRRKCCQSAMRVQGHYGEMWNCGER